MKIIENLLNLIYPPTCDFCNQICNEHLCKKCEIKIKNYQIISIRKNSNAYFDEILYIFRYEDIIRDTLIKYKFQNKAYLYKTFSKIILKNKKIYSFLENYDIIIPVPISKKRKRKRGYNQSSLIAKEIAQKKDIKYENKCLTKRINTIEQSKLDKAQRKINVQNAYEIVNKDTIINKKVLLLDDIYTTGNTVNECARVLKESGAKKVGVLTIAKD